MGMRIAIARIERLGSLLPAAWVALPVVVGLFAGLRMVPGAPSYIAQTILAAVVLLAAVLTEVVHRVGPPGIERSAWGVLSATLGLVFGAVLYYVWQWTVVSTEGMQSASVFEALTLLAALMIALGMAHIADVVRMPLPEKLRLFFDVAAFLAVTLMVFHHFVPRPAGTAAGGYESALWTAHSASGALVLACSAWLVASSHPGVERAIASLGAVGLAILGTEAMLWPVVRSARLTDQGEGLDAVFGAFAVMGFYMFILAALLRMRRSAEPWRIAATRQVNGRSVWVSTALSLYVLVGVSSAAWWVYLGKGSAESTFLLVGGVIATFALVARTGASAVETVLARNEADVDPVTGALGASSFVRRADGALAQTERDGRPFSLIIFDIDSFSRVNAALGHAGGDRVLADIAQAVAQLVAGRGELFRFAADEFAVICPTTEANAMVIAAEILAVIRGLSAVEDRLLSASVGVAGLPPEGCDRDELVHRAKAAEAWAKYHGKGRVVRFDERIVRALGVEERLRTSDDCGLNMVRAIASATDARDPRSYYHSRNVAALSVMFSEAIGIDPETVRRIEIAALLHDCGRLGLPESLMADVLRTSRQQLAAREHSKIGEMVTRSVGMPSVPLWVRHHHERWDGAGYPDGLVGEAVPLESRIIALADAYDTVTSGARSGVPASRAAALQEIDLGMGSRFDPMLAERFIEVVGETASLGWSDEWELR
jgi:diguanylate cyclase (GGDEF)-like protein